MIKGSEHSAITTLGQMQVVMLLMENIAPSDQDIRDEWLELKKACHKLVDRQWDKTLPLISEDDA